MIGYGKSANGLLELFETGDDVIKNAIAGQGSNLLVNDGGIFIKQTLCNKPLNESIEVQSAVKWRQVVINVKKYCRTWLFIRLKC